MLRFLIATALILLCTAVGIAQLRYGIKAGLNASDVVINNYINPDAESDFNYKLGFHGGIFLTADINEKFGSAVELLYSNKGVKAIDRVNLHYIDVPLLILYKISEKLSAELGPEIGYLIAAKSDVGDVSNVWNNKLDLGVDVGLRYAISDRAGLVLRYNAGFSSVIDAAQFNSNTPGETVKYQNRVFQLAATFNVGEKSF